MPRPLMTYDSIDEANNRLAGTIVGYEGRPVMISEVRAHPDGVFRVMFREWPYDGEFVRKRIDSPHFRRFATIPLGFCNFFGPNTPNCSWLERVSARSRRQGMCGEVFNGVRIGNGERVRWDSVIVSEAFVEMTAGEYPSFDDALARLVPSSSIAVDREFALRKTAGGYVHLHHRREEVGLVLRGNIMLRSDRQHLIEAITENAHLPDRVEVI